MDDLEWIELAIMVTVVIAWGLLRLKNRGRVVDARYERSLGSFGEFEVSLVSSPGGRRYVALEYEVTSEKRTRDIQLLLTPASARRLAQMLDVAVAPGKTLLQARVAARRKATSRRQGAEA